MHAIRKYADYVFSHTRFLQPRRQFAENTRQRIELAPGFRGVPLCELKQIRGMIPVVCQRLVQNACATDGGGDGGQKFIGFDLQCFGQHTGLPEHAGPHGQPARSEKRAKRKKLASLLRIREARFVHPLWGYDRQLLTALIYFKNPVPDHAKFMVRFEFGGNDA